MRPAYLRPLPERTPVRRAVPGGARRTVWLLLGLAAAYALFLFGQTWYKLAVLDRTLQELQARRAGLQLENARLREEQARLEDRAYLERLAREHLGLIKPGEKVLVPAQPGTVLPLKAPPGQNKETD